MGWLRGFEPLATGTTKQIILDLENFIEYRHFNLRGNISCDNLSFKYFMHLVASKRPASLSSNDTYVWVPFITISFSSLMICSKHERNSS